MEGIRGEQKGFGQGREPVPACAPQKVRPQLVSSRTVEITLLKNPASSRNLSFGMFRGISGYAVTDRARRDNI